jgi:P-type E1-E2 ATPase
VRSANGSILRSLEPPFTPGSALQISDLPSREVVPGDVVEMHVGDRVPADTRIVALRTATLRAEQASLTGESVAVLKSVEPVEEEACELQAKVRAHWPLHSSFSGAGSNHVSRIVSASRG